MKIRMYNMGALNAFITRMTTALESAFTLFNVSTPTIKFTSESTVIEYKISNVDGLKSVSFDIDNGDFGLWVILTQDKGKVTFKSINEIDEKLANIKNNTMLKMQLECIKNAVQNSLD